MIKFDRREFLEKEKILQLQELGVDMSDSKYYLVSVSGEFWILGKDEKGPVEIEEAYNTYTLSEILYKIPEFPEGLRGPKFLKDAPFYMFYYDDRETGKESIRGISEYPLWAAFDLLVECIKGNHGYVKDISGK